MTNVILCQGQQATKPYSVVGLGTNVFSAEELCYLISQNAHTLDKDFMDEKLCDFLDGQLRMKVLATKLREVIHNQGSLSDFVSIILDEVGYCDADEIRSVKQILVESAGLSPARKHKSRGDNLLKARKFARALDEYVITLEKIDKDAEPLLYAAVLHNMGTTYAKLLLYSKAANYFLEAYRLNMDEESLMLHLVCCSLYMKNDEYNKMLIRCGYSEKTVDTVNDILVLKENYIDSTNEYAKQLISLKELKNAGKISQYYDTIDKTLDGWKQEYRMNMILR